MTVAAYLRSIAAKFFRRSETASDVDEELREHIALRADDLMHSGLTRDDAERRARVEFGGSVKYREQSYEAMGGNFLETLMQDLRFALRVLRKSRGFAFAAIVTLALAIGANAVAFGIMDGLILKPLNVAHPDTLYGTKYGDGAGWQSYPNYLDLRNRNHSFEDLASFRFVFAAIDTGSDAQVASGFATTGNYFDVLGVQPFLGRFFHASDERGPNSAPYAVLSYAYWHTRFHEDSSVVGRVVQINKHPFTVIGVSPKGFVGTLLFISADFFMPEINQQQIDGEYILNDRGNSSANFEVFGHLKPGVTVAQALADMNTIGASLEKTYPKEFLSAFPGHKGSTLSRVGLTAFDGAVRAFVAGLSLLAGLILLAACANLGSLFAAHTADRSREMALRLALGSTRKRILRQLFTEAILISIAGAAAGLAASVVLLKQIAVWQPFSEAPIHLPVEPDARLYAVALALALVSGFLFGIVPVRQVMRANPYEVVKAAPGLRLGRRITLRDVLLVVQIALCSLLVTASIVALRGLARSVGGQFGFDPHNTMLADLNLTMAGYQGDRITAAQRQIVESMQTIPGVDAVGFVNNYTPLAYGAGKRATIFKDETHNLTQANVAALPYEYQVSPGYFRAAATAILAGREFTWNDSKNAQPVAVVNQTFARKIFGSIDNALGRFYRLQDGTRIQVVGVMQDGKYLSLSEDPEPAMFRPALQSPSGQAEIIVRSKRDPHQIAAAMRQKLHEFDPGMPADTQSWNDILAVVLFPARMATMALGVLGLMGAVLSITGIFGLAAFSVSRRLKELGIRIALGARRTEVLGAALGRAVKLLAIGSAAGLILGLFATKVLAAIVYQATPRDPVVLGAVVAAMALLGLVATWIPAQRALSIDPLALLREE